MEAWIIPAFGVNLCRFSVGGRNVIDFNRTLLLARDFTGTPVLYPTPNRVRNGVFRWEGKDYPQRRAGKPVLEHGLVHTEAWEAAEPVADGSGARLEAWLDFKEGGTLYQSFPFPHRLGLSFLLTARGIRVTYSICNHGTRELPFGFGLHPYFMKITGDDCTWVTLPANAVMDATSDLLPTGRLKRVRGSIYDLGTPAPVSFLDMDHVFTRLRRGKHARIQHRGAGLGIDLEATRDFTHLVLYTPRGEKYFCLENQTCSTDAHNLWDRGFAMESGLKTVKPGAVHSGSVSYAVHFQGGFHARRFPLPFRRYRGGAGGTAQGHGRIRRRMDTSDGRAHGSVVGVQEVRIRAERGGSQGGESSL
jgi:aldose 1-epimerase